MSEPTWVAGIRARTEALIEQLQQDLPVGAGPVAIERVLTRLEPTYLQAIAQELIDATEDEKKDILTGK